MVNLLLGQILILQSSLQNVGEASILSEVLLLAEFLPYPALPTSFLVPPPLWTLGNILVYRAFRHSVKAVFEDDKQGVTELRGTLGTSSQASPVPSKSPDKWRSRVHPFLE